MFISKKYLPRRTVLRGLGATVALPLLDAMVPAATALAQTAATPRTRVAFFYVPHGAIMNSWTPTTDGKDFELPLILRPLAPLRDHIVIVSGLAARFAGPAPGESGGEHSRSAAVYLSGARPKKTAGADVFLGTTVDQVIAQNAGTDTVLPSIQLGIESVGFTGICGYGYNCSYQNTISWASPTRPLPIETSPRIVFERLFGVGGSREERLARQQEDRSILDSIRADAAKIRNVIGPSDRVVLEQYLDDVREIERRLWRAESKAVEAPIEDALPAGTPRSFREHVELMHDLQVIAFRTEITRVSTMMYSRDNSNRTYPESGVPSAFHMASHHSNRPEAIEQFARINQFHVLMFADFLQKLRATPDGEGSLLDHAMVLYGSTMSNGNEHSNFPLPVLLAGGASGRLQGGRHVRAVDETPLSNLLLTMLGKVGIEMESFGDSTGRLEV